MTMKPVNGGGRARAVAEGKHALSNKVGSKLTQQTDYSAKYRCSIAVSNIPTNSTGRKQTTVESEQITVQYVTYRSE